MFSLITNYLEPLAWLIITIALLLYLGNHKANRLKVLLFHSVLSVLLMTSASVMVQLSEPNSDASNLWAYNIMFLSAAITSGLYFSRILNDAVKKKIALAFVAAYALYFLIKYLDLKQFGEFDSIGYSIASGAITLFVIFYFQQLFRTVDQGSLIDRIDFWINAGYILYFLGSFFVFLTYYSLTEKILVNNKEGKRILTLLWGIPNILLFVSAITILTGSLWITYRKK